MTLAGESEIELEGGRTLRFGPGHILLAEDTTGQGHKSRAVPGTDRIALDIVLAEGDAAEVSHEDRDDLTPRGSRRTGREVHEDPSHRGSAIRHGRRLQETCAHVTTTADPFPDQIRPHFGTGRTPSERISRRAAP